MARRFDPEVQYASQAITPCTQHHAPNANLGPFVHKGSENTEHDYRTSGDMDVQVIRSARDMPSPPFVAWPRGTKGMKERS